MEKVVCGVKGLVDKQRTRRGIVYGMCPYIKVNSNECGAGCEVQCENKVRTTKSK